MSPPARLIGRGDAHDRLLGWRDGTAGPGEHRRPVLITGPPGVGRTALARWLMDDTRAAGGTALMVGGTSPELEPALGPWVRLAIAAARAGAEVAPEVLAAFDTAPAPADADGTSATRPGPDLAPALPPTDVVTRRYLAALQLLDAIAGEPAVVVLDDVDRFDPASLELLARLAADADQLSVLLVATAVQPGAHPDPRGATALAVVAGAARPLPLEVLGSEQTRQLVVAHAGERARGWATRWGSALNRLGGGLPSQLLELIDVLGLADGARPALDASSLATAPGDGSVSSGQVAPWAAAAAQVVRRRLDALPAPLREVLTIVALADGQLEPAMLGEVTGRDVTPDLRVAEELLLIDPTDDRLALTHPLLGTLLTGHRSTDRQQLHARIGLALLARPRDDRDTIHVLRHLTAAGDQADPQVIAQLEQQLLGSPRRWDVADTEARALEPLWRLASREGRDARWRRIGLRLADAWLRAGRPDRGWSVSRELVAACPDDADDDLVAAARLLAFGQDRAPTAPAAVRVMVDAARRLGSEHPQTPRLLALAAEMALPLPTVGADLAELVTDRTTGPDDPTDPSHDPTDPSGSDPTDPGGSALHGGAASTSVLGWTVRAEPAIALVDEAAALLDAADATGRGPADPEVAAQVDAAWSRVHRRVDEAAERVQRTTRAAASTADLDLTAELLTRQAANRLLLADRSGTDAALAELTAAVRAGDDPGPRWRERRLAAMLALAAGQPTTARRAAAEAFVHARRAGMAMTWSDRLAQETAVLIELDEPLTDVGGELGVDLPSIIGWHPLRAVGWCWTGARDPALTAGTHDDPARLLALLDDGEVDDGQQLLFATMLADAVWRLKRAELAPRLIEVLTPWASLIAVDSIGVYCHGSAARPLAGLHWLVGDHPTAVELERRAHHLDARCGLHLFRLLGDLDRLTRIQGDDPGPPDRSRPQLSALIGEATELGLVRIAREASELLVPKGQPPPTERQVAVLAGLAAGATYEQIAQQLGYSHGTVRKEAIAAYRALGVERREDAVEVARLTGVLGPDDAWVDGIPGAPARS